MAKKDKRVDAYISKSQPFARPILTKLRALIHKGNPEVVETIKWGMPSFDYKGPFCSFAAFKQHAVFGFWKYKLIKDPKGYLGEIFNKGGTSMGNLGRMTSLKDVPPDKFVIDFVRQAKKLNDEGVKMPPRAVKPKKDLVVPSYFVKEVKKSKKAYITFQDFSPSQKREYVEWVTGAKSEDTRNSRLQLAIEWMAEGKRRNWKYER
jgi:hypothetical protein